MAARDAPAAQLDPSSAARIAGNTGPLRAVNAHDLVGPPIRLGRSVYDTVEAVAIVLWAPHSRDPAKKWAREVAKTWTDYDEKARVRAAKRNRAKTKRRGATAHRRETADPPRHPIARTRMRSRAAADWLPGMSARESYRVVYAGPETRGTFVLVFAAETPTHLASIAKWMKKPVPVRDRCGRPTPRRYRVLAKAFVWPCAPARALPAMLRASLSNFGIIRTQQEMFTYMKGHADYARVAKSFEGIVRAARECFSDPFEYRLPPAAVATARPDRAPSAVAQGVEAYARATLAPDGQALEALEEEDNTWNARVAAAEAATLGEAERRMSTWTLHAPAVRAVVEASGGSVGAAAPTTREREMLDLDEAMRRSHQNVTAAVYAESRTARAQRGIEALNGLYIGFTGARAAGKRPAERGDERGDERPPKRRDAGGDADRSAGNAVASMEARLAAQARRIKQLEGELQCAICLDARSVVKVDPCAHMCMCEGCALEMDARVRKNDIAALCPMCRAPFIKLERVWFG